MRVLDDNHRLDMVGGSVAIFVKLQHFYRDLRYRHCVGDMSDSSVRHLSSCCCCRCSLHLCSHWSHGDINVTPSSSSTSSSCSCCSSWRSRDLEVTPCHCYKLSSSCSARSSSQHCTTTTTTSTNRDEDRSLTRRSVRSSSLYSHVTSRPVLLLVLLLCWLLHSAACCSSRAKPRVSVSSEMELDRRRMPAHMYDTKPCPEMYEKNFCLNGGTCFCVYIGRSPVFSCVCDDGFMGRRCEFKYLDGHYAKPEQQQQQQHVEQSEEQEREGESLETAGVTAAGAVVLITALCLLAIINVLSTRRRIRRNNKHCRSQPGTCRCVVNEQQQQQQQQEMVRCHCNHDHDHITDTTQTQCVQCCNVSATSLQQQQSCIINNVQV